MKLYGSPASPFVRKVLIALHETGMFDDVEQVEVANTPVAPSDDVAAHNPLGKIPCLERNDGVSIYDSRVITRYLAALKPAAGLYPDGDSLWEVLTLEATADGLMDAAVLMTYEKRVRPEEMVYQTWIEAQWLKIDRTLGVLESRWLAHLNGPVNMGVLSIAAALGYIDFRHGDRNWRDNHPKLAAWEAGFSKRPSVSATIPQG